jgi:serine phosphatase RsbU (regulator of sigma subunit)
LIDRNKIRWIIFLSLFLSNCTQNFSSKKQPFAQKGLLDLRSWDFKTDGSVELDGEWEFYWKKFVPYTDTSKTDVVYVTVPSTWNKYQIKNQKTSGYGYGTYKLTVLLSKKHPEVSIKLLSYGTAYKLYANGNVVVNGKIATTKQNMTPYALPQVTNFSNDSRKIELVMHISNFHHPKGGFWSSIKLGNAKQIQLERDRLVAIDLIIAGCLLILAVYHLVLFAFRSKDLGTLYFSIVALLFSIRTLMTDEKYLLHLFPNLPWELTFGLEYLTIYLGLPFYLMFYQSLYKEFSKIILQGIKIIFFSLSILVVATPASIYAHSLGVVQVVMLLIGFYVLYTLIIAITHKREASKIFLAGFLILLTAILNDYMFNTHLVESDYYSSYGLLIFIFSQSFVLSVRYAKSFSEVENMSATLEKRVEQRTAEITMQNVALEKQKNEIAKQAQIIEKKNENITASINYASRIQQAILGSREAITSNFKNSFILLKPKDIVSGDFYWYTEVRRAGSERGESERRTVYFKIIAAADCTGHGIPGAFMTVLGNALLDEIINENRVTNPARILSILDRKLLMKLQKHGVNDGMDISMLIFDEEEKTVFFAGANNPLYYVSDGQMFQIKGSKFPIGSSQYRTKKKFDLHKIQYKEGDIFYLFSDGFQDQFGGEEGKKYYTKRFRELLHVISHLPVNEQQKILEQELEIWRGSSPQTDDILVIGIRT